MSRLGSLQPPSLLAPVGRLCGGYTASDRHSSVIREVHHRRIPQDTHPLEPFARQVIDRLAEANEQRATLIEHAAESNEQRAALIRLASASLNSKGQTAAARAFGRSRPDAGDR